MIFFSGWSASVANMTGYSLIRPPIFEFMTGIGDGFLFEACHIRRLNWPSSAPLSDESSGSQSIYYIGLLYFALVSCLLSFLES
jgi:hypothetical protein